MHAPERIAPGPDVLSDPLFAVLPDGPDHPLPLALLLARLLAGPEVEGFPQVAAEQRSYWWRFLVRSAARALHEAGLTVEDASTRPAADLAGVMETALRKASGEGAWPLYQPDPQAPAFLQPPTPEGSEPHLTYARNTPSLLTGAIGSKNHERKVDTARALTAEQTVYALVEYQTGAIFGGRGNYGSQLMGSASGAGSGTPFMGVRLGTGEGEAFRHDVGVMLATRDRIRRESGLRGEVWALWAERWDGTSPLPAEQLDPFFVPLARMVRLGPPGEDGCFRTVWFRPTSAARVADHTGGGNLGDPFTPLVPDARNPEVKKVRGTLAQGYDYLEVVNLLFSVGKRPGTPAPSVAELRNAGIDHRPDVRVVFEGTAYEQGKTGGFHRREVLLPTEAAAFLADPDPVRETHGIMLGGVSDAKSALRGAARILLSGAPRRREGDDAKVEAPAARFEAEVDRHYVGALLRAAERHRNGDDGYRREWAAQLSEWARAAFRETRAAIPTTVTRRYEREVKAESWLEYRLRLLRGEVTDSQAEFDTDLEETPA